MRHLVAIIMLCVMLTGCTNRFSNSPLDQSLNQTSPAPTVETETTDITDIKYDNLNDSDLHDYVEQTVYSDLVQQLNSEEYFVENVETSYVSKEYIDELAYNSKSNIYFGYSLAELDEIYGDTRYVFTLGEDGKTTVKAFEVYDDSYEQMIKNVAVGTGVILVCVTVSVVSGGAGASAVSMIFATSAKTGMTYALSSGVISSVVAGVVKGVETKDFNEALKVAAVEGSEAFKWGAIGGILVGGISKATALHGATCNGLTMNQAARIQQESKWPLELIKNFHSEAEYNTLKSAGLSLSKVNGKTALVQKIDWDFIGDVEDGRTNAQRVLDGLAPLDLDGKSYELHHIGQKADSPLAILTSAQHKGGYSVLHTNTGQTSSNINRVVFEKQKKDFWKSLLETLQGGA